MSRRVECHRERTWARSRTEPRGNPANAPRTRPRMPGRCHTRGPGSRRSARDPCFEFPGTAREVGHAAGRSRYPGSWPGPTDRAWPDNGRRSRMPRASHADRYAARELDVPVRGRDPRTQRCVWAPRRLARRREPGPVRPRKRPCRQHRRRSTACLRSLECGPVRRPSLSPRA